MFLKIFKTHDVSDLLYDLLYDMMWSTNGNLLSIVMPRSFSLLELSVTHSFIFIATVF